MNRLTLRQQGGTQGPCSASFRGLAAAAVLLCRWEARAGLAVHGPCSRRIGWAAWQPFPRAPFRRWADRWRLVRVRVGGGRQKRRKQQSPPLLSLLEPLLGAPPPDTACSAWSPSARSPAAEPPVVTGPLPAVG